MSVGGPVPAEPPADLVYRHKVSLIGGIRSGWRSRRIMWALAERQLRARYKQSLLGFAWALITPLALMVAFTLLFDRVAEIDTSGAPYALFSYLGLLPWTFFASSLNSGSASLLFGNQALLTKIPIAREVFPLSSIALATVDSGLALVALGVLFVALTYMPHIQALWIPVLFTIQLLFTVGCVLGLSVVVTYIRDIRQALPLILQFGLFVTPVAYGLEVVPSAIRPFYSFLNPLGPVIDGYRRTVLHGQSPEFDLIGIGAAGALCFFLGGFWVFKKLEPGIADVS
jgi:ABC-2 type transport system permease protein/lipopolysaccharide transport system permease protein